MKCTFPKLPFVRRKVHLVFLSRYTNDDDDAFFCENAYPQNRPCFESETFNKRKKGKCTLFYSNDVVRGTCLYESDLNKNGMQQLKSLILSQSVS